jgi:hypothetical protein
MIHELWVGMEIEASLRYKWWGRVQKLLIKFIIGDLRPLAIHTNTRVYQLQLAKMGIKSTYLPLFPNIPVKEPALQLLNNAGSNVNRIKLLIFGAIHLHAPIDSLAREAAAYESKYKAKIILTFLGKTNKNELTRWANVWKSYGMDVEELGERPAEQIAEIFATTKFGITATALAMTEKSGSVVLMKAYGIKVLCLSRPWTPRGLKDFKIPDDIIEYTEGCFESFINGKTKRGLTYSVSDISFKLVNDLELA